MTPFLLAISLILNGIAIFSVIILYARQNRLQEIEKSQEKMVKDMEEVISAYLFELKEENEEFIKKFQKISENSHIAEHQRTNSPKENLKKENAVKGLEPKDEVPEKEWANKLGNAFKKQAVKAYKSTVIDQLESSSPPLPSILEDADEFKNTGQKENNKEINNNQDEIYRNLFINQVKLLKEQGLSVDEIAKKMNKGKTEIELLLKFS